MRATGGDGGPSTQGHVNHSRNPAFQVGQRESGGALSRLEQRRDRIRLRVNRVTLAMCWANKEKEGLEQKQEAS